MINAKGQSYAEHIEKIYTAIAVYVTCKGSRKAYLQRVCPS